MPIDLLSPLQAVANAINYSNNTKMRKEELEVAKGNLEVARGNLENNRKNTELKQRELDQQDEQFNRTLEDNQSARIHDETMAQKKINLQNSKNRGMDKKIRLQEILQNPQNSYTPNSDDIKELVDNKRNSTSDYIRNNQVTLMGGDE